MSDEPRTRQLAGRIQLYRQPGGCLEISQFDEDTGEQDLVHIELEDLVEFVGAVALFIAETTP